MEPRITKKLFACLSGSIMLYLIVFSLQGCQKQSSIDERINVKTNLANKPAPSKIIYHDVVPDITMVSNVYSPNPQYNLDIDGDRKTDFTINDNYYHLYFYVNKRVSVSSLNMNAVACDTTLPLEMNLNDTIASNLHWVANATLTLRGGHTGSVLVGNWTDANDHYLGLKINSGGSIFYGWMRLNISVASYPSFTVKDYAYNSTPNQFILAGQTQ